MEMMPLNDPKYLLFKISSLVKLNRLEVVTSPLIVTRLDSLD